jgi:hypothetical protein
MVDTPQIDALVIVVTRITSSPGHSTAKYIVGMSGVTQKPITVAWTTADLFIGDNLKVLSDESTIRAVFTQTRPRGRKPAFGPGPTARYFTPEVKFQKRRSSEEF